MALSACSSTVVSKAGLDPAVGVQMGNAYSEVRLNLKSWRCPEAFANSLEMIISSAALRQSMGQASRRRAEDMGWDRVASDIADIYESLT